jgi:hypothetical protein
MDDEFECVGDIYIDDQLCTGDNDDEQPASSAVTALEAPWSTEDNAGFVRDEAILVVIAITDEDEQPTIPGVSGMGDLYDRLAAIKGDVKNVVFYGIGGSTTCTGPYGEVMSPATDLKALTDLFIAQDRGVWHDLCEGQIEDGLDEAFEIIEAACDEFEPIE